MYIFTLISFRFSRLRPERPNARARRWRSGEKEKKITRWLVVAKRQRWKYIQRLSGLVGNGQDVGYWARASTTASMIYIIYTHDSKIVEGEKKNLRKILEEKMLRCIYVRTWFVWVDFTNLSSGRNRTSARTLCAAAVYVRDVYMCTYIVQSVIYIWTIHTYIYIYTPKTEICVCDDTFMYVYIYIYCRRYNTRLLLNNGNWTRFRRYI